jgi:hypothetical protein
MGWFNRTEEEARLMRGPLSGYSPVMPWNQDANIRHNRRLEEEARRAEMIANNPALAARLAAEEEAKAVARANEQWVDTRRTDDGYAKVYSDDVRVARNMAQDDQMAQEAYNRAYGTDYAGGPTQAGPLSRAPLAQMVTRPDTSGGLVQVGPLNSGNARPVKFNDALDSYYDEANNKLNIVY